MCSRTRSIYVGQIKVKTLKMVKEISSESAGSASSMMVHKSTPSALDVLKNVDFVQIKNAGLEKIEGKSFRKLQGQPPP
jgi:hypothetical protein